MGTIQCFICNKEVKTQKTVSFGNGRCCRTHLAPKAIKIKLHLKGDEYKTFREIAKNYRFVMNRFLQMWGRIDTVYNPDEIAAVNSRIKDAIDNNRKAPSWASSLPLPSKEVIKSEVSKIIRTLHDECPDIASGMIQVAKQSAASRYKTERKGILVDGTRGVSRHSDKSFDQNARTWSLKRDGDNYVLTVTMFSKEAVQSGRRESTRMLIPCSWNHKNTEIKQFIDVFIDSNLDVPQIKFVRHRKGNKDEWYAVFNAQVPVKNHKAVEGRTFDIWVDDDPNIFLCAAPSDNPNWKWRLPWEDVRRKMVQFEKRRLSMSNSFRCDGRQTARHGRGRKRAMKAYDNLRTKRENFQKTWNHQRTHAIVQEAIKRKCEGIRITDLCEVGPIKMLGDWTYYQFLTFLEHKCQEHGLSFVKTKSVDEMSGEAA